MEGGPNIQDRESLANSLDEDELRRPFNFFCHPLGNGHRFIALIFMCFLGFGSYFCFDNPAALQNYIKKDLNLTVSEYTMLYSIYSWPNVVLCFVGGVLVDKVFGIRLGTNIYMVLTMLGHLGFATGVFFNHYWLMLVGRFIFGIGGESLAVAQNSYAVQWFKGKELNMVFGLQLSFARVGSTVNFMVMEPLYSLISDSVSNEVHVLGIVLYIAGATCIFSMTCALILGILDKRAERIVRRNEHQSSEAAAEGVRMLDIKDFNLGFWLITLICVTYYITIFPFMSLAKDYFTERFDISNSDANQVCSILYIISGVVSPIFGFLIDRTGNNITWILTAVVGTLGAHSVLAFTKLTPYVGMVMLGIFYSTLASSLWPLVSLIIPEHEIGTAYGVCQAIQNLGLAVVAIIAGLIVQHMSYLALELFFLGSLALCIALTILLMVIDRSKNGILNLSPAQRLSHQQSQLAAQIIEREKLISEASTSDLEPSTDFHIRNSSPVPII